MTIYQLYKTSNGFAVLRDGKDSIPFDPDNTDYQTYLKWVAKGNTPLPADAD